MAQVRPKNENNSAKLKIKRARGMIMGVNLAGQTEGKHEKERAKDKKKRK